MKTRNSGIAGLCLLATGFAASFQARAEYELTVVEYPGAAFTQFFGINNAGRIVGNAAFDAEFGPVFDFEYDSASGEFTPIPDVPGSTDTGVVGINERGTTVGASSYDDGVSTDGFILDKGVHHVFRQPGWDHTNARAVGSSGLVTGYSTNADFSDSSGFIYDPKRGTFTDIDFPDSPLVIAQGISGRGDVVGSVALPPDGAYPGSPAGNYAFLRDKRGGIALFRVNETSTRARGISDAGKIVGFYVDSDGTVVGFVGNLPLTPGTPGVAFFTAPPVETLVVPDAVATFPQGINNKGTIVGSTFDENGVSRAFIATPLPAGKK